MEVLNQNFKTARVARKIHYTRTEVIELQDDTEAETMLLRITDEINHLTEQQTRLKLRMDVLVKEKAELERVLGKTQPGPTGPGQ